MRVHLSLGSNLGDREVNLQRALEALEAVAGIAIIAKSHYYETEPVGVAEQPDFLNLAVEIETELAPLELLNAVKEIEARLGRTPSEHWGPRVIDIDIILWGERTVTTEPLMVPHKEFRKRAFVLAPLAEIAPDAVDPVTGKTVTELLRSPEAQGQVVRLTP
ncbi:MAG TPA: 2-amino-4-hydroxy-6-hydroxymethyldihydropteridine diphosphokinase [Candidatus Hydrogenedentes bacterium]|nr:2-amino-4-hydroxy-6-hydroxymethyldihydropteridine diphosphokinase [Candidatus Hydrogenedentota bacterium]